MANVKQWLSWLKRPPNKGQGHLFWYSPIYRFLIRLPVSCNFCCRTQYAPFSHNTHVTDRQTTDRH